MSRNDAGFTLVELFVVIALLAVGGAMVAMVTPGVARLGKADSGSKQVAGLLRQAREEAIAKRRNVEVSFDTTNHKIEIRRVEYDFTVSPPKAVENVEQILPLEGDMKFQKYSAIGTAVPMTGFAPNTEIVTFPKLSTKPTVTFTPEGSATDPATGDPVDGTIFLGGRANEPMTARAVTVSGVTANIERWQWNQSKWVSAK